jgi:uncharacterized membrane protein
MFHKPVTSFFILFFFAIIIFFFILLQIDMVTFAFIKIGIPHHYILLALLTILLGSFINIPLKKIPQEDMVSEGRVVHFFGSTYVIPASKRRVTILAVNIGGAVIPTLIAIYLLLKTDLYLAAFGATFLMTAATFKLARPMQGVGIVLPFFVPPVLAALISGLIAYSHAPVIAYISGTLGTLIGGDLLNLKKIRSLGAPVASIGGAGTFDGIFLTGILSVVLSALFAYR